VLLDSEKCDNKFANIVPILITATEAVKISLVALLSVGLMFESLLSYFFLMQKLSEMYLLKPKFCNDANKLATCFDSLVHEVPSGIH
jgi:hypothetical protein